MWFQSLINIHYNADAKYADATMNDDERRRRRQLTEEEKEEKNQRKFNVTANLVANCTLILIVIHLVGPNEGATLSFRIKMIIKRNLFSIKKIDS